jgi:hypothetical protein
VSERFGLGLLLSCLAILLIGGCASTPADPDNSRSVSIGASFKQLGIGSNISRVLLEISGSGFTTITQDLDITNGIVRAEVEVPFGMNRVFALTAYAGQTALYYGDTADVSVSASAITEVSIYMHPQVPMIKITPMYSSISSIGIEGTLRVEVYNVDSLFGLSLRLEVDSSIIEFLHEEYMSVEAGDFLGTAENTLFFPHAYPHYLSISYVMQGDRQPKGVTGSGLIATVKYVAKKVGKTPVTINPAYLRLIDWQGNALPQIYIENGEVEVLGY